MRHMTIRRLDCAAEESWSEPGGIWLEHLLEAFGAEIKEVVPPFFDPTSANLGD
jgi:hypothetical protein